MHASIISCSKSVVDLPRQHVGTGKPAVCQTWEKAYFYDDNNNGTAISRTPPFHLRRPSFRGKGPGCFGRPYSRFDFFFFFFFFYNDCLVEMSIIIIIVTIVYK